MSFSSHDGSAARDLRESLKRLGVRSFKYDQYNVAGVQYQDAIVDALERSRVFLLLYSRHAAASKHVKAELAIAFERDIPLLCLRLDDSPFEKAFAYCLQGRHSLRVVPGGDLGDVVRHLGRLLGRDFTPNAVVPITQASSFPRHRIVRTAFLFGVGAVLALAFVVLQTMPDRTVAGPDPCSWTETSSAASVTLDLSPLHGRRPFRVSVRRHGDERACDLAVQADRAEFRPPAGVVINVSARDADGETISLTTFDTNALEAGNMVELEPKD